MDDEWSTTALTVDVTAAASAVQVAAVAEAGRQADAILGPWPVPGGIEWHAEEGTDVPVRRERAWQLLQLRIGLGAGLDPLPTLVGLRRHGATWEEIARAAGMSRPAAHERWAADVSAVLEPSG
ncbi:MAG: hypothetical protein L0H64_12570 [Pseudonocardia sp.]|nr:hypothetical protein [Pseudonocardia sp.]